MSTDGADMNRRRFLTAATSAVGGVGVAFAAIPFISYWQPSAQAQAAGAPVEVDISKLEPGQRITIEWRGKPVWIIRRTPEVMEELPSLDNDLRDAGSHVSSQQPPYAQNEYRARETHPEVLVVVGICTHLGCSPSYVKADDPHSLGENWKGGFFCPCHGSRFDMAGRVYQGVPAPINLQIPPYAYMSDTRILVGESEARGVA